jgi:endonuclease/exonuclease/phosphatase family metal-dependent hydrolase
VLPEPLRLLTYNVRYFGHALRGIASTRRPKLGIAHALASLDPIADVVCMQEVETISVRSRIAFRGRHERETQLESFMTSLGEAFHEAGKPFPYDAYYFPAHTYGPARMPIYTTGLAILVNKARWLVDGHNTIAPHHITHHHVEAMRDRKQTRICAHIRLQQAGSARALHVFNTHLSLPTPFAREFWSERQKMGFGKNQLFEAQALAAFVRERAGGDPFVVCGDFNSPPGSPVYRFLTSECGLVGVQESLGLIDCAAPRGFPTAGLARLRMHLDHVFSSSGIRWLDMDMTLPFGERVSPFHGLSDHVPLVARFAF